MSAHPFPQPQISPGLSQLASGYEHRGLHLDLYGTSSKEDGIEVEDVTLTGSIVSLAELFSGKQFADMSYWCEREAEREAVARHLEDQIDAACAIVMRSAWGRAAAFVGALVIMASPAPADAATITSKPGASTMVTITTCPRFAGAICSLVAGRTKYTLAQYVDAADHGRLCQSAVSLDYQGEGRNPTEGGSMRDGAGPTSTSKLLYEIADGQRLHTQTQMAYWYPWQGQKLSNYVLEKRVQIGFAGMDNVIEYLTEYAMPRGEVAGHAVFEALTCYMPTYFSQFVTYDRGTIAPLDFTPGEQALPIIAQTNGGAHAMGIYSPDSPQQDYRTAGYGRWRHPDTTKWNNVFRINNPSGTYKFRSYIIVGSTVEVQESMRKLHEIFGSQK